MKSKSKPSFLTLRLAFVSAFLLLGWFLGYSSSSFEGPNLEDTLSPLFSVFFAKSDGEVDQIGKGTLRDAY